MSNLERAIIHFISKQINKTLNSSEILFIKSRILYRQPSDTFHTITQSIISDIISTQSAPDPLTDLDFFHKKTLTNESDETPHNIYDNELSAEIVKFLTYDKSTLFELSQAFNPSSKEYYSYILFDTNNKNIELSTDGHYQWNLNDGPPIYVNGTINLCNKLHPIKRMRLARTIFGNLHGTEYLKLSESADNRFAVTIQNLDSQSFITNTDLKFHFIQYLLDSRVSSNPSLSSYNTNRGWYHFNEHHNTVDQIGISITPLLTPTTPLIVHETEFVMDALQSLGITVTSPYGNITNPIFIQTNLVESLGIYWASVSPTGNPDTDGGGTTSLPFQFGGWSADDPINATQAALITAYNSSNEALIKNHSSWFQPPVDISGSDRASGVYNVTITFKYKPRMTAVLELISEIPADEKIT